MRRRDFVTAGALAMAGTLFTAAFRAAAQTGVAPLRLKITDIRTIKLKMVNDLGFLEQISANPPLRYHTTTGGGSFTEVHTDQGVIGIGPGVDDQTIAFAKSVLVGKDPFDMNDHAFRLYNPGHRGGGSVELALWDLIGKVMNQPLYRIWGGATADYQTQPGLNRVLPYASQWTVGTPEDRTREVQLIKSEGWKAMKLKLGLETVRQDVALMEAARKAAGKDFALMCDGNKAGPYGPVSWPRYPWTFERALETARGLAPLNLTWLEEPLPRFDYDQLAQLNKMGLVPLAGGENDVGVHSFLTMLQKGSFAYLQPEVLAVGPTMLRTVATLAAAYDVQVAPHGGSGGVCWIGIMHLIASMPNAPMMELIHEPPHAPYSAFMDIFTAPPLMKDGFITVPDGPGLGVTIRPDLIQS
jgi:L-alanine-DL-glutamate epimerase-like enolase superfamily enzyme